MRKHAGVLALLAILVVTSIAYTPAIDGEFVLDDYTLAGDPLIRDPRSQDAGAIFASTRPLAMATFVADRLLHGLDPRGWHITNIALHLAVVLLALRFARVTFARAGMARPDGPALAATAIFSLHPLQTQSVAYITQRSEVLASGFVIGALLLLLARDTAPSTARRGGLLAGAAALQALGLLAKPIASTVPLLWLLHAAIAPSAGERDSTPWRRAARRIPAAIPLLALSSAAAAWGLGGVAGATHAGFSIPSLPMGAYLATQLRVVPTYLQLFAWPANQSVEWGLAASRSFMEPGVLAGGALLLALVAAAIAGILRVAQAPGDGPAAVRVAGLGLLTFLVTLSPTSIVPLVDVIAVHRTYLGLLGLSAGAVALATVAIRRFAPAREVQWGVTSAVIVALAAGVATARRSALWTSELSLLTDAAEKTPAKARLQMNLGYALLRAGRPEEALRRIELASELSASDKTASGRDLAVNLVDALIALGRIDEARARLGWMLRRSKDDSFVLALLAKVDYASGQDEAAERNAAAALRLDAGNGIAKKYLGMARLRRGDPRAALLVFQATSRANVVDPELFEARAKAEESTGDIPGACSSYEIAAGQPGDPRPSERARAARARLGCP